LRVNTITEGRENAINAVGSALHAGEGGNSLHLPRSNTTVVLLKRRLFMRVTTKGQVTIPRNVREILGIVSESEVEFQEDNGRFFIVKASKDKPTTKFAKLRGIATVKMSTDEIMNLTREII